MPAAAPPAAAEPDRFTIRLRPTAAHYARATEPAVLLRELAELGQASVTLEVVDLPSLDELEVDASHLSWTVTLATTVGADAIVVRHPASGAAQLLKQWLPGTSIINAGDGKHQHPTQALLDAVTMRQRIGEIAGRKVVIVGDIVHSRVARSNVDLLHLLGAEVVLVAPPTLLPTGVEHWPARVAYDLDAEIADADVVMMLRVQAERMHGGFFPSHREYATLYGLSAHRANRMKEGAIIMHPGPMLRGMEINFAVAERDNTAVLQQVTNGVYTRMAVLFTLLVGEEE